jgi:uncharacterized protein (UPF0297 family)
MSYHIRLDEYKCSECEALYIPYEENLPCPNCKVVPANVSKEYFGFITELIASLRVNKIKNGNYFPDAWYIGSFTDYIQDIIFHIFNALEKQKFNNISNVVNFLNSTVFVKKYLDSMEWDEESLYRKDYINSIIQKIYSRKKELKISLWTRLLSKLLN